MEGRLLSIVIYVVLADLSTLIQSVPTSPQFKETDGPSFTLSWSTTTKTPGPTHDSRRCEEFNRCTSDMTALRSAVGQGRWKIACRIITPVYECQEGALQDCRQRKFLPGNLLARMENAYIHTSINMHSFCDKNIDDSQEKSKHVRCSEYRQCWVTRDRFVHAAQNQRREEACRYVTPIYECTSAALTDCKVKGTFPQETLKVMEKYMLQAKVLTETHCSYNDDTLANGMSDMEDSDDGSGMLKKSGNRVELVKIGRKASSSSEVTTEHPHDNSESSGVGSSSEGYDYDIFQSTTQTTQRSRHRHGITTARDATQRKDMLRKNPEVENETKQRSTQEISGKNSGYHQPTGVWVFETSLFMCVIVKLM